MLNQDNMILIGGAGGKTGRAIIQALHFSGIPLRAFERDHSMSESLRALGVQEVFVGDLQQENDLLRACEGIHTVIHIPPNMCEDELGLATKLFAAAKKNGVKRFVYHSVLHPQIEVMAHHWQKLRVEEKLFESGLNYTILQPAVYMQNVLAYWQQITEQKVFRIPYAFSTCLGMVDLKDVAEATALVLTQPNHAGAIYELANSERLTQTQVAEILSEEIGIAVRAEKLPADEWEKQARSSGLSQYALDTLKKMFVYYEQFGFWGNGQVLECLLGRKPTSFRSFVRRVIEDKKNE